MAVESGKSRSKQHVKSGLTRAELLALPVTTDLATAARALGIGRNFAQRLAAKGEFPCHVERLGRVYRVVTPGPDGLLAKCGVPVEDQQVKPAA